MRLKVNGHQDLDFQVINDIVHLLKSIFDILSGLRSLDNALLDQKHGRLVEDVLLDAHHVVFVPDLVYEVFARVLLGFIELYGQS